MKYIFVILFFAAAVNADMVSPDEFKRCVSGMGYGWRDDRVAQAFIQNAGRFGNIWTKREAFMAIAQMGWESAGFTATSEWACTGRWSPQCDNYDRNGCPGHLRYFGRGYIQLTHCFNYKACNEALKQQGLNGDIVNNPDIVARDPTYAMATAMWYWKSHVHEQAKDGRFGSATWSINGALECKPNGNIAIAIKRWDNLNKCLAACGTNIGAMGINEHGCYN